MACTRWKRSYRHTYWRSCGAELDAQVTRAGSRFWQATVRSGNAAYRWFNTRREAMRWADRQLAYAASHGRN